VDDVASAAWELVLGEASGIFHAGGPDRMTRYELAVLVARLFGFDAGLVSQATRPADRPRDVSLDSKRLSRFLGWSPRSLKTLHAVAAETVGV
jgi:dTDP-4-dehydrorhamnose reductase